MCKWFWPKFTLTAMPSYASNSMQRTNNHLKELMSSQYMTPPEIHIFIKISFLHLHQPYPYHSVDNHLCFHDALVPSLYLHQNAIHIHLSFCQSNLQIWSFINNNTSDNIGSCTCFCETSQSASSVLIPTEDVASHTQNLILEELKITSLKKHL